METFLQILTDIFEVCIIPLLGILTTYLVKYIQAKNEAFNAESDSALAKKYTDMLTDTITTCVIATNQTYVETLKQQGSFDKTAQEAAFQETLTEVLKILNDDAKTYLKEAYGDLDAYIINMIEATVNEQKTKKGTS
jgi:hypothetical protein